MYRPNFQTLIAAILMLIFATGQACAAPEDGFTYKSKDGRLGVWVPAKPQVSERNLPSKTGAPYRQITVVSESNPSMFIAGILDFRQDLATTGDETSYLDTMLASIKAGFGNGFVMDKSDGTKELVSSTGQKGRQIKGIVQGQCVIIRAFVGKHSIYMQQVGFPVNFKAGSKSVDRFLDSLSITD